MPGNQVLQGEGHEGHQGEHDMHGRQTPRNPKALLGGGSMHC